MRIFFSKHTTKLSVKKLSLILIKFITIIIIIDCDIGIKSRFHILPKLLGFNLISLIGS